MSCFSSLRKNGHSSNGPKSNDSQIAQPPVAGRRRKKNAFADQARKNPDTYICGRLPAHRP
ncbi:MAG: hypothetical protein D6816_17155 [Bacteroidetes bacterium]|nr:MAG: hypothetical protein D6816_17155 [Bacteroidota bacterium]